MIVTILLTLVVVGVVLWAVNQWVPMQAGVKRLLNITVICLLVLWILRTTGVLGYLTAHLP